MNTDPNVPKTAWRRTNGQYGPEARLLVDSISRAVVTLWPPNPGDRAEGGSFAILHPAGQVVAIKRTFKDACQQAMRLAGVVIAVPEELSTEFHTQDDITSNVGPGYLSSVDDPLEIQPSPNNGPLNEGYARELCELLDEVMKSRLFTMRDTSNDWPVVATPSSFRPDLAGRVDDLLVAVGYRTKATS